VLLREELGGTVLAIAQPAHAALSGRLAEAWDDDLPDDLVVATGRHDDVWMDWDAAPRLNPATGRPQTFLELDASDRVGVWSQAPVVAAPLSLEAELWVLRHAERLHVKRDEAAVKAMTAAFGARIAELVAELRSARAPRFDDAELARGTSLLALFDTLSLVLCFGVTEPRDAGVLTVSPAPDDGAVAVAPWPFTGARVDTFVEARRLPGRVADQAELDAAWAVASPFALPVALAPGG
jgi:hypothetical protein